jgi:site-specific recombinase XerD
MTTNGSEVAPLNKPLQIHIDSFLDYLQSNGYVPQSVVNTRSIVMAFARWIQGALISVEDLNENHLAAFVKRRAPRPYARVELRALRRFVAYLRIESVLPSMAGSKPASPANDLTQLYIDYLQTDRGLAKNSILVYTPFVRDFLIYRLVQRGHLALEILDAETIRAFMTERIVNRSSGWVRLLGIALRSLLRFLFLRGKTPRDLSPAVPMVRTYSQSGVPAVLSPQEVERILSATNRSTTSGSRDYAILLLLARLGLRAGEIVSLELSDIHWRTGEILVRGKGPRLDYVPLLADVGEALAISPGASFSA